jgi:signal transduction histidine kinase
MTIKLKNNNGAFLIIAFALILISILFPKLTEFLWLNIIAKIRESINSGDSGPLVLSAALYSIVSAVQNALVYLAAITLALFSNTKFKMKVVMFSLVTLLIYVLLSLTISSWHIKPWEGTTGIFASIVILLLCHESFNSNTYLYRAMIVSMMVFFAFQWLNVMPAFSIGPFGVTDISVSIKLSSNYLNSDTVLNFVALAFFIPLFMAAWVTTSLFSSHDRNIAVEKENHTKEIKLEALKSSAMEHRIYQEINAIAHDLKTPLVTIRGLNSLLALSGDTERIGAYTIKIENAVEKMSEMISGFLYESSKQDIEAIELINYMRAQIPVNDEVLKVNLEYSEPLSKINVNKIRVSRALLNIVENAIVAPTKSSSKVITLRVFTLDNQLTIEINDNGTGIPPSILEEVWEPGFSTKESTGLGLFFVRKIVEDNDGTVCLYSKVDEGTTVVVRFPQVER